MGHSLTNNIVLEIYNIIFFSFIGGFTKVVGSKVYQLLIVLHFIPMSKKKYNMLTLLPK
jgi:hypothetical protein